MGQFEAETEQGSKPTKNTTAASRPAEQSNAAISNQLPLSAGMKRRRVLVIGGKSVYVVHIP
jgi:hypothetical protein